MRKLLRELYLPTRFFYLFGVVVILFSAAFPFSWLFPIAKLGLICACALVILDGIILFNPKVILTANRKIPKLLSLGDENQIHLIIENEYRLPIYLKVVDEIPVQLQIRDLEFEFQIPAKSKQKLEYPIRPLSRGEYVFNDINLFLWSFLGFLNRRIIIPSEEKVPVYPSVVQMKQYELWAFSKISHYQGIKKMRRIGHSYEFEQIKPYVSGDDFRSINWNATGSRGELMVNQYEDERAQQVYCIIDKSRAMKMPFSGLSLMDYAINTSLVISNIALHKEDKAGLLTFSDKIGTSIKAERKRTQLRRILAALYNEKEQPHESNYELLYRAIRNVIRGRSLLFLYTNFESAYAVERVLPVLRRINRLHLLVVVFFENTELIDYGHGPAESLEEIYHRTIAADLAYKKRQIVQKLSQYGIQAILTRPEDLSINSINKYLELKARGMI